MNTGTEKLYRDRYACCCTAAVVKVNSFGVALNRTVAYPEGGGQESDRGVIRAGERVVRFGDVRRLFGAPLNLSEPEFKDFTVGGSIFHVPLPEDREVAESLVSAEEVEVEIDAGRRERLSVSHTASHLL